MKKTTIKVGIALSLLSPLFIFADTKSTENLKDLVNLITEYFQYGVYLVMSLAVLAFVWNIFQYFIAKGDDVTSKKEAGLYVMYSIIGFFVILSLWGLVRIVTTTLNLNNNMPNTPFGVFKSTTNNNSSSNSSSNNPFGNQNSSTYRPTANTESTITVPPLGL